MLTLNHHVQYGFGAHPASYPGALSLGIKRPARGSDHSPPSSADVKNAWSYTSTPQYVFMAGCLIKHRVHQCKRACITDIKAAGKIVIIYFVASSFGQQTE
jgi:hypothetical protein